MDYRTQMEFLCGEDWKTSTEIKTHLVAKNGARAGTGTIRLFDTVGQDMLHQLQISRIGRIDHFASSVLGITYILPIE